MKFDRATGIGAVLGLLVGMALVAALYKLNGVVGKIHYRFPENV
jgi:uncharacterized protein involved in exopolysaccharide biosynthesis